MLVISHRGNLSGPNAEVENLPSQIDRCISGYTMNVEVDLWRTYGGQLYLGHDEPTYEVNIGWLYMRCNFLWIHCKNSEALVFLQNHPYSNNFNFFWHESDDYTITSRGYLWAYPGKDISKPARAVAVLPEINSGANLQNFYGVCTDFPEDYIVR